MSPREKNILGIATPGRGAAVVLLRDNQIAFAIEEEKLNRYQEFTDLPGIALARCLSEQNLSLSGLSAIAVAERAASSGSALRQKRNSPAHARLLPLLRGGPRPVSFDHHLCHAASAYYTSGLDRALILSLDEGTASRSGLLALGSEDEIKPLCSLKFPDSFGWIFSRITELAGLRPHRDEHKLQWLSRSGQPDYLPAFRKLIGWKTSGLPILDRRYFAPGPDRFGIFSQRLYRELGLSPCSPVLNQQIRANLARSVQDFLEESVLQLACNFAKRTGARSLCLAGGVFLNLLLVHALETRGGFDHLSVQPVSGNPGTALGAAYLLRKKSTGASGRAPLSSLALGVKADSHEIKAVLDNCKISYRYLSGEEQTVGETSHLLLRDKIVGWCQGRSEFGHRALGHRSLLASPFSEYVVENVNQFIKHREEFHPFALSVPAERASEFFSTSGNGRFMASLGKLVHSVPALQRFAFSGNLIRVHTVERQANPLYWKLLHKFGESAPAPILVNTSFNLFGEPLVTDPREAVRSFYCSGIDALALGPFLLVK